MTLDADVAEKLRRNARSRRLSFKQALNEALRRGLVSQNGPGHELEPFVVRPHDSRFRPGIDLDKLGQLSDDLEASDAAAEMEER